MTSEDIERNSPSSEKTRRDCSTYGPTRTEAGCPNALKTTIRGREYTKITGKRRSGRDSHAKKSDSTNYQQEERFALGSTRPQLDDVAREEACYPLPLNAGTKMRSMRMKRSELVHIYTQDHCRKACRHLTAGHDYCSTLLHRGRGSA